MGMVTDDSELRLEGVSVSAQISDIDSARVVRTTLTDDGVDDDGNFNEEYKGQYQLLLSPDTSFNIVVFSGAKVGGQMYSPACEGVVAPIDHGVVKNFSLEKSDFGSVSGKVMVTTNSDDINPDDPPAVYVSFYASLSCGYVEITTLPVFPDTDGNLEYLVDLPLGTYDVVASAEGFIPDTGQAALDTSGDTAAMVDLFIIEQPGI
jgi:hypothetical protein